MRHVFDANCWRIYVDEKLSTSVGLGSKMFEPDNEAIKILFDAGQQIRHQYISMKLPYAEEVFNIWFEEKVLKRVVDVIDLKGTQNHYAKLIALGLPKKEHIYFRVAIIGKATLLVSLDSDFFDPKHKNSGEKQKREILSAGDGPVCKFMSRTHSVEICCPEIFCQK